MRLAADSGRSVWCGSDAITEEDYGARKEKGLSRFIYPLGARDPLILEGALDTIDQHHPGEVVWVEAATPAE
nr:hypothetical protein [Variovorax dokdonensis]